MAGQKNEAKKKMRDGSGQDSGDSLGKQNLLTEIEKNAREEARGIIESAEKTKSQKIAAAEGKAKRIVKDAEERAEAKIKSLDEQTDSSIEIQKKRIRLKQTEEIIRHIFCLTRDKIEEKIGSDEYLRVLRSWTAEAVLGTGADRVELFFSERELPLAGPDFLRDVRETVRKASGRDVELTVSDQPEKDYGVRARSADGRLEFRNQVGTRLSRRQNEYRKMIYATLEIEGAS